MLGVQICRTCKICKTKVTKQNLPNQVFEIDDLVKAVNAWVRSAFGNVFFFYEVECDFTAIFKRENKPAEGGQYLLDGKERCSESRSLPKILAIIAPKAVPSIIDCTIVFSHRLCNGFLPLIV